MAEGRLPIRKPSAGSCLNGDVTVEPGEVRQHVDLRLWKGLPGQIDDVVALAGVNLQADRSARCEDAWCVGKELTDEIESVDAAIEG